jgi:hypothetical protein
MISDSIDSSDYVISRLPICWLDLESHYPLRSERVPLIGLGLSIAGQEFPSFNQFAAAIHAVTVRARGGAVDWPDLGLAVGGGST